MHKAKATALICIDFRFQNFVSEFLNKKYPNHDVDIISVAGSSRDLVKPIKNYHGDALWRQLELSVKLHEPDEVVIIDHQDCGGYAQDDTIKAGLPENEDFEKHKQFLLELKEKIQDKFTNKTVITMFLNFQGEFKEV